MFEVRGEPLLTSIQRNFGSGVTVALVNIPLSISLAVASDGTPSMGCVTVIWAGSIAAFMGGSHYNVVGPTGALSGLLSIASVTYGQDVLPLLAIMGGLMSFVVFFTKLDKLALFVPANTMQGFTIAVAFIIACNQINFALGLDKLPRHPSFVENVMENLNHAGDAQWQAVVMFLCFLIGQFSLSKILPRIPWAIVMASIGICLGYLSTLDGVMSYKIKTLDSRYPGLSLSLFNIPSFRPEFFVPKTFFALFSSALSITFIAILETLISAKIADRMTKTKFNQRQEVLSISLANLVCGLFGGIPATAALARTALNIKSGATSRMSGIICSVSVICLSLIFLPYFKFLPLPNVAAILVNVAVRMIEVDEIKHIYTSKRHFLIMLIVAAVCILVEPTSGIIVGILLSMGKGAFMESKAWVLCKLRQGDTVLTQFNCNLEIEERIFTDLSLEQMGENDGAVCCRPAGHLLTYDEELQMHVFGSAAAGKAEGGDEVSGRGKSYALSQEVETGEGEDKEGEEQHHLVLEYKIGGPLTYVTATTHSRRFQALAVDYVLLNLSRVTRIDVDGIAALEELVTGLEAQKKHAYICGIHRGIREVVRRCQLYEWMRDSGRIIRSYKEDKDLFLKSRGPSRHVSDSCKALKCYLTTAVPRPSMDRSDARAGASRA